MPSTLKPTLAPACTIVPSLTLACWVKSAWSNKNCPEDTAATCLVAVVHDEAVAGEAARVHAVREGHQGDVDIHQDQRTPQPLLHLQSRHMMEKIRRYMCACAADMQLALLRHVGRPMSRMHVRQARL